MKLFIVSILHSVSELEQIVSAARNVLGKYVSIVDSSAEPFIIDIEKGDKRDLEKLKRFDLHVQEIIEEVSTSTR